MSKGKDFRGPRKRGFDDDGPSSFEFQMPRPPRPLFGGTSSGGGFGGEVSPSGPPVDAIVKWFKADKGFGFVELLDGTGDAFLHINAVHAAGHEGVPPGSKLKVQVGKGPKGAQVTHVLEIDTSTAHAEPPRGVSGRFGDKGRERDRGGDRPPRHSPLDPSQAVDVSGTVKWFDNTKGFGFVAGNDGGKDIFVHISVLRPSGVTSLAEGQSLSMRVVDTPKGREAISVALL